MTGETSRDDRGTGGGMTRSMPLSRSIGIALAQASGALSGADVPHAVGGSVLLHALGIPVEPRDVDILTAPRWRAEVAAALDWERLPPPPPSNFLASAWIDRFQAEGVVVEVMADMTVLTGEHRFTVPVGGGRSFTVDGVDVPLGDPVAWLVVYRVIRPERAEALAGVLDSADIVRADALSGSALTPGSMPTFPLSP